MLSPLNWWCQWQRKNKFFYYTFYILDLFSLFMINYTKQCLDIIIISLLINNISIWVHINLNLIDIW